MAPSAARAVAKRTAGMSKLVSALFAVEVDLAVPELVPEDLADEDEPCKREKIS